MKEKKRPNERAHFIISALKSVIRILGCISVISGLGDVVTLAIYLGTAEVLGLLEELF